MTGLEKTAMKRYYPPSAGDFSEGAAVDKRTSQIIALLLLPAGIATLFHSAMEGCALILIAACVGLLGSVRRN